MASSLWSGPSAISLTSDSQIPSCLVALPALQLENSAMRMRSLVFSLWKSHPTAKDWWVTPNSVAGRRVVRPSAIGSTNQLLFTKEPVTLLAGKAYNITKLSTNTHHEPMGRGVQRGAPNPWGLEIKVIGGLTLALGLSVTPSSFLLTF